jgi:hypothetical protein
VREKTAEMLGEFATRHAPAPAIELPTANEDDEGWNGRLKRKGSAQASLYKNAARTVLFTASNGETALCDHDKRALLRVNQNGTVLVVRFGTVQAVVKGRRLEIQRDAFEVHRIDDIRPAANPEFDLTSPKLEHVADVRILPAEDFQFGTNGGYEPL